MKILHVAAELAPFAKVGGLADVVASLPAAQAGLGHDVAVLLPGYRPWRERLQADGADLAVAGKLRIGTSAGEIGASLLKITAAGVPFDLFALDLPAYFDRDNIYGYDDDAERFAAFGRMASVCLDQGLLVADVVHGHDWHAAPALMCISNSPPGRHRPATMFTIHNLAYQGVTGRSTLGLMDIEADRLPEEWEGAVNFMAQGIALADRVTTVSPNYALEVVTEMGGSGLHNRLIERGDDFSGIVNGLDFEAWDPWADSVLRARFSAEQPSGRAENKHALQTRFGLRIDPHVPLLAMISRLDYQKGIDILLETLEGILAADIRGLQFIGLGSGDEHLRDQLVNLTARFPDRAAAVTSFEPELARLIYGGSDLFLMPSRFEPCGLGQLIAMRYGSVPVARRTGGLADTVIEGENGFLFDDLNTADFEAAIGRALVSFRNSDDWSSIQQAGMVTDSSWDASARAYLDLYEAAIEERQG